MSWLNLEPYFGFADPQIRVFKKYLRVLNTASPRWELRTRKANGHEGWGGGGGDCSFPLMQVIFFSFSGG